MTCSTDYTTMFNKIDIIIVELKEDYVMIQKKIRYKLKQNKYKKKEITLGILIIPANTKINLI